MGDRASERANKHAWGEQSGRVYFAPPSSCSLFSHSDVVTFPSRAFATTAAQARYHFIDEFCGALIDYEKPLFHSVCRGNAGKNNTRSLTIEELHAQIRFDRITVRGKTIKLAAL